MFKYYLPFWLLPCAVFIYLFSLAELIRFKKGEVKCLRLQGDQRTNHCQIYSDFCHSGIQTARRKDQKCLTVLRRRESQFASNNIKFQQQKLIINKLLINLINN